MSGKVERYNTVSRGFHWAVAVLILGLLIVGFFMDTIEPSPFKYQVYGWHKATGIAVLFLGVCRIIWKHITQTPESLSAYKQWEKILSKTIHIVLYVAIIAMPLSGWIMSSAGGYPISFFGLFEVPGIVSKVSELGKLAKEAHEIWAWIIIGCVVLHIAGALKHHILDKDTTLNRMGGNLIFAVFGLLALAIALSFPAREFIGELFSKGAVQEVPLQDSSDTSE